MTQQLIGGITLADWAREWKPVKGGLSTRHDELKGSVGVFRLRHRNEVLYIGCAREYANGGLMKRLFDFIRPGDSGRKHYAGQKIFEHRETLEVDVIVTGSDHKAGWTAQSLKTALLKQKKPAWNATCN